MKPIALVLVIVVVAAVGLGGMLISSRNELVRQSEDIRGTWSQVEVVLQRRADLIPNLVATVKGFAAQEKGIFESLANARAALMGARTPQEKMQANTALDSAIGRLLLIVENYPTLKSNENFLHLQDELAGAENRIAQERRKYNEAIQKYNTSVSLFPGNIAASLFSFSRNDEYFKTEPAARQAPKVSF